MGPDNLLKEQLALAAAALKRVQFPMILTIHGDVVVSLSERSQMVDEYISHAISVLNLSGEFLSKLNLGEVSGLRVRGVGETVLNLYVLADKVFLACYCLSPSERYAVFDTNDIDRDIQPYLDEMQLMLANMAIFER